MQDRGFFLFFAFCRVEKTNSRNTKTKSADWTEAGTADQKEKTELKKKSLGP